MAHQLYVTVRWNGAVIEQRLCVVNDEVWLGAAPCAEVAFPGPSLRVRRRGEGLQVQGRWLAKGAPVRMTREQLEVTLEAVELGERDRFGPIVLPDIRVLVASAAVVLLGAWWEAVDTFLVRHPGAVAQVIGVEPEVRSAQPGALPSRRKGDDPGQRGVDSVPMGIPVRFQPGFEPGPGEPIP